MERTSTPLKLSATYTHGSTGRIPTQRVRDRARKESHGCIFGDIPEFLDRFFPVDQLTKGRQTGQTRIQGIMEKLMTKGHFRERDSKWNIPDTTVEKDLYRPLLRAFSAINKICVPRKPNIEWRDIHSTPPDSIHDQLDRPDIAAISRFPGMVHPGRKAHWHDILVPVEVKGTLHNDDLGQLLGYVRVMLREQWNRRFTFGLLFTARKFQVWLFDQSGAIGSTQINFHDVSGDCCN